MRRLLEVLLILTYNHLGRRIEIEDGNGGLKNLSFIINHALQNRVIPNLSKESNEVMDVFRQLGNFSVHRIEYNARKPDINNVRMKYRVTIEEVLYASNVKK